jgi:alkylresorcinol/alkylpyrone synthase
LRPSCRRLSLAQLGCAGGTAALATAAELVRSSGAATLVVSAEAPSLQLPLAEPSLAELVAATQFGDGAAAAIVARDGDGPEIFATASELLPEAGEGGAVLAHESGLRLRATGDLPGLIRKRVAALLDGVLAPYALASRDLAFVAAHPRAVQVLQAIADGLALAPDQVAGSFAAFAKHGNMISASIFAVLAESARRAITRPERGTAAMIAFGTGTSCEMALLRWQRAAELEGIAEAAA